MEIIARTWPWNKCLNNGLLCGGGDGVIFW